MNTGKVKKIIVGSVIVVCILVWVCIKFIFPRLHINGSDSKNNETKADDYIEELYNPENTAVKNKHTQTGGTVFQLDCDVKKVTATKKLSKEIEKAIKDSDVKISNGTITNDYRAVKVCMNIKNSREIDVELTLNTNWILYSDLPGSVNEPFLMLPYDYPPETVQHFHCKLSPGEEKQLELYYVLKDEDTQNTEHKIDFVFNPNGLNEQCFPGKEEDASNYFIHIDISEKVRNLEDE